MEFASTRDDELRVPLAEAIEAGLAPDGGLFVPPELPQVGDFAGDPAEAARVAEFALAPFFEGDRLEEELGEICDATSSFPVPLERLDASTSVLELFHGPTAAFKDVGARFLAECLSRLNEGATQPLTILVATSGDTGAAVAAAFEGQPNVEVVVLFPDGMVSDRQEQLLTCWGGNVTTFAVEGTFDDCQRMVKSAFGDERWQEEKRLSSANSINLGRLLPQVTYYARASLLHEAEAPTFVVPTGNAGNVLACLYAREMGFPIGDVVMATNENRPITHFLDEGEWQSFPTERTLASAMDVGDPSNFERLRDLWPTAEEMGRHVSAGTVADDEIREVIREEPWGRTWDPHTACAVAVCRRMDLDDAVVVATAHPAKFPEVVEPLVGRELEVPEGMGELLERSVERQTIAPELEGLGNRIIG